MPLEVIYEDADNVYILTEYGCERLSKQGEISRRWILRLGASILALDLAIAVLVIGIAYLAR